MRTLVWLLATVAFFAGEATPSGGVALELGSYQSGESSTHRLTFDIVSGELEPYRIALTYPSFAFAGFAALGPPGTPVGAYEVDANFDGTPDRVVPLRVATRDTAYVDVLADGEFSESLEPAIRHTGGGAFRLQFPFGGDANRETVVVPFGARVTLVLFGGLLVNPALGGRYVVVADLMSADPDTGGPDDGTGMPPQTARFETAVDIDGPLDAPFARLRIDHFDIKRQGHNRDRFTIRGQYLPGAASDGIALLRETVSLSFEGFHQVMPGQAFVATGGASRFTGREPGITLFMLFADGRFRVDARGLSLQNRSSQTIRVSLRIGNDHGDALVGVEDDATSLR
jgi:hypothetical protein